VPVAVQPSPILKAQNWVVPQSALTLQGPPSPELPLLLPLLPPLLLLLPLLPLLVTPPLLPFPPPLLLPPSFESIVVIPPEHPATTRVTPAATSAQSRVRKKSIAYLP
jgi:hypothetical protein